MRSHFVAFVVVIVMPLASEAATLKVPQQYGSIQAAIDAASDGDVIRVAAGTYSVNLSIEGKALSLIGAGADTTIRDGGARDHVILAQGVPAGAVTIAGFTIRNGFAGDSDTPSLGGGLLALDAPVIVRDNTFTGNSACMGLALTVQGRSVTLLRNKIVANTHPSGCGWEAVALLLEGDSLVDQNVIADNPASGVLINTAAKATVRRNIIRNNTEDPSIAARGWGGLGSSDYLVALVLENNLFENNSGSSVGGVFLIDAQGGPAIVRNNSFVGNSGPYASGLMLSQAFYTGFDISSNLFADDFGVPEIECGGVSIGKGNVFAAAAAPALAPGCSFAQ